MQLKLTARHDNRARKREITRAKLSKLDRRLHDLTLIEVTFSLEHNPSIANDHTVRQLCAKGPNLVVRESAPTYEAAIDRLPTSWNGRSSVIATSTVEMRRRSQHAPAPVEPTGSSRSPRPRRRQEPAPAAEEPLRNGSGRVAVGLRHCRARARRTAARPGSSPVGPAVSSICWNSSSARCAGRCGDRPRSATQCSVAFTLGARQAVVPAVCRQRRRSARPRPSDGGEESRIVVVEETELDPQ
jgi:hypothetical protein